MDDLLTFTAFSGNLRLASGSLETLLPVLKSKFDEDAGAGVLVFNDQSGRQMDFDLRGSLKEVLERAIPAPRTGPGRPRLGVVSREVSLLPRHWDWLEAQPSGASAALRRLVEEARKKEPEQQRARAAREAIGRFLSAMAGNLPGYEEASRALYAGNGPVFGALTAPWPNDIREYVQRRLAELFPPTPTA